MSNLIQYCKPPQKSNVMTNMYDRADRHAHSIFVIEIVAPDPCIVLT